MMLLISEIKSYYPSGFFSALLFPDLIIIPRSGPAQGGDSLPNSKALKKMSLKELTEVASAIQVITKQDIIVQNVLLEDMGRIEGISGPGGSLWGSNAVNGLENKSDHINDFSALGNDPKNRFLLQSNLDLPGNFQFDMAARIINARPNPAVRDYFTFNARLTWTWKQFEISVSGQDLWQAEHTEITGNRIPRNIYAKITCRL